MRSAADIIDAAQDQVGIADEEGFALDNLERLLESLVLESVLSEEGFAQAHRMFMNDTVNRLEGLKWVQEYPEIAAEAIEAPVFLMGLPRSGTTFLQYLFDRDPRFRLIRTWEAMTPSPPPGADPASAGQRRAAWAERRRQLVADVEGFNAMHLHDDDGSEECHAFLEQSFGAVGLNNLYRVPAYFDYLMDEADLEASYRVHRRQLQLLQWRAPNKPWALKYPNHVIAVPQILAVYPDARFVMTHRDPVQTLASISKLSFSLRSPRCDRLLDKSDIGHSMTHFVQRHIERIMAAANGPWAERIIHVDYYALVRDPLGEMLGVHRQLGIDSPAEVRDAVVSWHRANPRNARGVNVYGLAEYGLDEAALAEQFHAYMQRFDIPREHAVGEHGGRA